MNRGEGGQRSTGLLSFGIAAWLFACTVYDGSLAVPGSTDTGHGGSGAAGDGPGASMGTSGAAGEPAAGAGGSAGDGSAGAGGGGGSGGDSASGAGGVNAGAGGSATGAGGSPGTGGSPAGTGGATGSGGTSASGGSAGRAVGGAGGAATGGASGGAGGSGETGGSATGGASGTAAGGTSGGATGGSATGGSSAGGGSAGGASGSAGASGGSGGTTAGSGGSGGAAGGVVDAGGPTCNPLCAAAAGCPARSCWIASANPTPPSGLLGITDDRLLPSYAIDGNEVSRYTTGELANGDEWFQIDLCRAVSIAGVNTYTNSTTDLAASYTVQVSMDGANWTNVVTSTAAAQARMSLTFPPVVARFVRYNQTGMMTFWWSLHEISVVCSP